MFHMQSVDVWVRPGAGLREYPIYICAFRCDPRNLAWIIQGIHWESEKACERDDQRAAGCLCAALLCNTQLCLRLRSWMLNEQRPPRSSLGMIPFLFHWRWNAPDCWRSRPMQRWWKCWFTGVIIWDSRQSYKQQGRLLLAPLRPVRFIVNYSRLLGRRSRVHSYINLVLFMGNYKTPRIIFPLPHETGFEVAVRCCHFLKLVFS